jgi:hypothetical protein
MIRCVGFCENLKINMHNNVVSPRSLDIVFKRIGNFVFRKGLAAQFVACFNPHSSVIIQI